MAAAAAASSQSSSSSSQKRPEVSKPEPKPVTQLFVNGTYKMCVHGQGSCMWRAILVIGYDESTGEYMIEFDEREGPIRARVRVVKPPNGGEPSNGEFVYGKHGLVVSFYRSKDCDVYVPVKRDWETELATKLSFMDEQLAAFAQAVKHATLIVGSKEASAFMEIQKQMNDFVQLVSSNIPAQQQQKIG
jgi:hypothetical protein